jgi:hypothetical protein
MSLLNGTIEQEKPMKMSRLFYEELKVSFPKGRFVKALAERWSLTDSNVYIRIKNDRMNDLVSDIQFIYENFAIGFDMKRGFFFDEQKWKLIEQRDEMENASLFGMSK